MSGTASIGKNLPEDARLWRNLAHFLRRKSRYLSHSQWVWNKENTVSVPQEHSGPVYHFRTPSPGGQWLQFRSLLLANFFVPQFLSSACKRQTRVHQQRVGASLRANLPDCIARWVIRPTPLASRKGTGARRIQPGPYVAASLAALQSTSSAISYRAKHPDAAPDTPRAAHFNLNDTLCRSAKWQCGVLRFQDQTREAPCSKSS